MKFESYSTKYLKGLLVCSLSLCPAAGQVFQHTPCPLSGSQNYVQLIVSNPCLYGRILQHFQRSLNFGEPGTGYTGTYNETIIKWLAVKLKRSNSTLVSLTSTPVSLKSSPVSLFTALNNAKGNYKYFKNPESCWPVAMAQWSWVSLDVPCQQPGSILKNLSGCWTCSLSIVCLFETQTVKLLPGCTSCLFETLFGQ